jgi:hypothetical protein
MSTTKLDILREAASAYGAATIDNDIFVKELAREIRDGFVVYIGAKPGGVRLVPPTGTIDPLADYRDEAFSTFHGGPQLLEPIKFGLCIEVPNIGDAGSHWLTLQFEVMKMEHSADVFVGNSPKLTLPLPYENHLASVFERLFEGMMDFYSTELGAGPGIGFIRTGS